MRALGNAWVVLLGFCCLAAAVLPWLGRRAEARNQETCLVACVAGALLLGGAR